jgi:hypothetical protein
MEDEWLNICLLIFMWPTQLKISGSVTACMHAIKSVGIRDQHVSDT